MYYEVQKAIFTRFVDNWNTSDAPIKWPRQRSKPTGSNWITIHLLNQTRGITRDRDGRGAGIVHFGVFSTDSNVYKNNDLITKLAAIFERKRLETTYYVIRFQEFEVVQLPDTSNDLKDLEVTINHHAVRVEFQVELKRY